MSQNAAAFSTGTSKISDASVCISYLDGLFDKGEEICKHHREDNPDLYRHIELREKPTALQEESASDSERNVDAIANIEVGQIGWEVELRGKPLREKIRANQRKIRQHVLMQKADIIPRTQTHNRKCKYKSEKEEREFRTDVLSAQIKAWRSMLPNVIKQFAKIPDYRRVGVALLLNHPTSGFS